MKIDFRQGIVQARSESGTPDFLEYNPQNNTMTVDITDTRLLVTAAYKAANYTYEHRETQSAVFGPLEWKASWGPAQPSPTYYFYWDFHMATGQVTTGYTPFAPAHGYVKPTTPGKDQHFFDLNDKVMYLYTGTQWVPVIRVFAGSIALGTHVIVHQPFGSQIGYSKDAGTMIEPDAETGYIMYGMDMKAIRTQDGYFFTTVTPATTYHGSFSSPIRLELANSQATASEPVPQFYCVTNLGNDTIGLADGAMASKRAIGVADIPAAVGQAVTYVADGLLYSDSWNWNVALGKDLFCGRTGELIQGEPVGSGTLSQKIGTIIGPKTILIQIDLFGAGGQGGIGDTGPRGPTGANGSTPIVHVFSETTNSITTGSKEFITVEPLPFPMGTPVTMGNWTAGHPLMFGFLDGSTLNTDGSWTITVDVVRVFNPDNVPSQSVWDITLAGLPGAEGSGTSLEFLFLTGPQTYRATVADAGKMICCDPHTYQTDTAELQADSCYMTSSWWDDSAYNPSYDLVAMQALFSLTYTPDALVDTNNGYDGWYLYPNSSDGTVFQVTRDIGGDTYPDATVGVPYDNGVIAFTIPANHPHMLYPTSGDEGAEIGFVANYIYYGGNIEIILPTSTDIAKPIGMEIYVVDPGSYPVSYTGPLSGAGSPAPALSSRELAKLRAAKTQAKLEGPAVDKLGDQIFKATPTGPNPTYVNYYDSLLPASADDYGTVTVTTYDNDMLMTDATDVSVADQGNSITIDAGSYIEVKTIMSGDPDGDAPFKAWFVTNLRDNQHSLPFQFWNTGYISGDNGSGQINFSQGMTRLFSMDNTDTEVWNDLKDDVGSFIATSNGMYGTEYATFVPARTGLYMVDLDFQYELTQAWCGPSGDIPATELEFWTENGNEGGPPDDKHFHAYVALNYTGLNNQQLRTRRVQGLAFFEKNKPLVFNWGCVGLSDNYGYQPAMAGERNIRIVYLSKGQVEMPMLNKTPTPDAQPTAPPAKGDAPKT